MAVDGQAYRSELRLELDPPSPAAPRPELADVGKLVRRGVRAVVGAARAEDRATLSGLLLAHLGQAGAELDVVEEAWPGYEHVNVQAGLDTWLAGAGRTWQLVGVVGFQHRPFGLGELLSAGPETQEPYGPRPGNASRVNRAAGPDGESRPCVRCGVYLVTEGVARTAVLVRGPEPESGLPTTTVQVVSTDPELAARAATEIRAAAMSQNVFRGQVLSFGSEVFGHGQTLL
ncbi:hypothetical protein O2W18_13030 [Modestobacter sp. VKM Ac-2983]|uniref:hypothetical protein n=1 Tax=Modestobacter sp. VKM Ac-2983 TaxID=3004137 RepID=UPI0022AB7AF3|nr:hypothetical protein [Modestobacter sp. VKM Ac-2983]MCZ2806035.1 hypothetical protein [Modestobacter sp. VKM Ac-2983]